MSTFTEYAKHHPVERQLIRRLSNGGHGKLLIGCWQGKLKAERDSPAKAKKFKIKSRTTTQEKVMPIGSKIVLFIFIIVFALVLFGTFFSTHTQRRQDVKIQNKEHASSNLAGTPAVLLTERRYEISL